MRLSVPEPLVETINVKVTVEEKEQFRAMCAMVPMSRFVRRMIRVALGMEEMGEEE